MDAAKRQAIEACGRCRRPEDEHLLWDRGEASELQVRIWRALGYPCAQFVTPAAAVIAATPARGREPAIGDCGRCGQAEDAHKHKTGTSEEDIAVIAALGGPCPRFIASRASVVYARHLAGHRGERVVRPVPGPGRATYSRGAAKAREALGITPHDQDAEAS
jgi:hypothetical protein